MRLREDGTLDFQRIGLDGSTVCFGALERVRGAPPTLPPEAAPEKARQAAPEAAKPDASDTSLELVTPPGVPPRPLLAPAPKSPSPLR
jgi:hypothetical protein